jgi:hypothetical protein
MTDMTNMEFWILAVVGIVTEGEFWILAVVPILAAVALGDSITRLSARISSRFGLTDRLWIHLTILVLFSVALFGLLFNAFEANGVVIIRHYMRAEVSWIRTTIAIWLFGLDVGLILLSIVAALVLAIKQGRNVLLSIVAGMLGNIGTIMWMIREKGSCSPKKPADVLVSEGL